MALNVNVTFYGLCHFIEDSTPQKKGMCIVLPEAADHESKISVKKGTLVQKGGSTAITEIDIYSERVEIELSGSSAFSFKNKDGNRQAVLEFKDLTGNFGQPDPQIVKKVPPGSVRGQIILREGDLGPFLTGTVLEWQVKGNVLNSAGDKTYHVADKALWKLSSQTANKASIKVTPFGEAAVEYELTSSSNDCELEIFNECKREDAPKIDEDFRYHYHLLETGSMAKARKKLKDNGKHPYKDIPLPIRITPLLSVLRQYLDRFDPDIWLELELVTFHGIDTVPVNLGNLYRIEEALLAILAQRENPGNKEQIEELRRTIRTIIIKATSSGGTGTGCNCLGCLSDKLPIEA